MQTTEQSYTDYLLRTERAGWRRFIDVQAPYRWNLRRLSLGRTLDLGCGIGRNLAHLRGHGVGIDHNADSVAAARARGLEALTPDQFFHSAFDQAESFDAILLAHVAEHMTLPEAVALLRRYLYLLKPRGRVVMITPQEAGYRSDATHVQFMTFTELRELAHACGLRPVREFSFPLPRWVGRFFKHNEFVLISEKPVEPRA